MDANRNHFQRGPARIEYLRVKNYRVLQDVELRDITPLTVLLGPNGSGKSTLFDVFAFLSECFEFGLRRAWARRGKAKELKTRGATGTVTIELKYREEPAPNRSPLITYHLEVDEENGNPVVLAEWLQWRRKKYGKPFRFLEYRRGEGRAVRGQEPDEEDERVEIPLKSPDLIAVNALGQFADHPRVAALRDFITSWHVSYLSIDQARTQPEAGPQERLSRSGDNLANVIQYLHEQHPQKLEAIFKHLQERVPQVDRIFSEIMPDGRLLLKLKDRPFNEPILARFASDGTLKMLAYLVLLYDPAPPPFIGIEEPENFLYHLLLPVLAEECRNATAHSQILVTTHSPFFVNALRPEEVRILARDENGYAQCICAKDIEGIQEFMEEGALLGDLWIEGRFNVGDPFSHNGQPVQYSRQ